MSLNDFQKQTLSALSPVGATLQQGSLSIPNMLSTKSIPFKGMASKGVSFLNGFGGKATSFLGGGMGDVMGVASGINNIFSAQGNTAQKQMQRGDAITDTVASGLSFIPGFGQAAGVALKLVNGIGGKLIKQPSFMKNFTANQNVMQNASAFGGVAAGIDNANATKDTFKSSGLVGKLIGKSNSRKIFQNSTDQQNATQTVLTESQNALDNAGSSADMFSTRNLMNQSGNYFTKNKILFGQSGLKFKKEISVRGEGNTIKNVLSIKLQKGGVLSQKGVSSKDKSYWNGFVDYLNEQGYKDNPDLNDVDKNLSRNLWSQYGRTKGFIKDYDEFIPSVQSELKRYREESIDRIKNGDAVLKGFTKDQTKSKGFDWDSLFMPDLSPVDGLAGIKTTKWKLPTHKQNVFIPSEKEVSPEPIAETKNETASVLNNIQEKDDLQNSPSKHKEGGAIKNVIVGGELHARKHSLHDLDEYKDVKMTKKGVPVIVKEDGGVIEQTAEVEREELILHLELTKKIEKFYKENTDESAIEAGKLLSIELTQNLVDNSNVLEKIIKNEED